MSTPGIAFHHAGHIVCIPGTSERDILQDEGLEWTLDGSIIGTCHIFVEHKDGVDWYTAQDKTYLPAWWQDHLAYSTNFSRLIRSLPAQPWQYKEEVFPDRAWVNTLEQYERSAKWEGLLSPTMLLIQEHCLANGEWAQLQYSRHNRTSKVLHTVDYVPDVKRAAAIATVWDKPENRFINPDCILDTIPEFKEV